VLTTPKRVLSKPFRIAVDIGGTFTDLVLHDVAGGTVEFVKVSSTPDAPARAVLEALDQSAVDPEKVGLFAHGSTIGTNALITRDLPPTALITTEGFRDVHEIRRGDRDDLWDAYRDPPPPYIRRRHRLEVPERIDYEGRVVSGLDLGAARRVASIVSRRGYESVAVCFVNAHTNGEHEREMARILADAAPAVAISLSSEVSPTIFEHERTSTTVINACLRPRVTRYLEDLEASLAERGYEGDVLVLHSGGGVMTARSISRLAARIAKSGPAAGAVAMSTMSRACGLENAIGVDIGGTSADVSIMSDGELHMTDETSVEFGYPILFPGVDVATIGAGGGSIAWVDDGGSLRNGPLSAGAEPGPACYGRGGTLPTNTDAQLVLGRLGSDTVLAGRLRLDLDAAAAAIEEHVARPLGLATADAAQAMLAVAEANVGDAIRLATIKRGRDPRRYVLIAAGGAGPLMGAAIAGELGVSEVVVPVRPGLCSALGGLLLDLRHDGFRSWFQNIDELQHDELAAVYRGLEDELLARLAAEHVPQAQVEVRRSLDLRYRGQWRSLSIEIETPLTTGLAGALERFHVEHQRAYSYARPGAAVEVHGVRVEALGRVSHLELADLAPPPGRDPEAAPERSRDAVFGGRVWRTPVLAREALDSTPCAGPVLIEQADSTTVVPPGWSAQVDGIGHLRLRTEPS
jgi:N-methylhydantoinase A